MPSVYCKSNCERKVKSTGRCGCKSVTVRSNGECSMVRFSWFKQGDPKEDMDRGSLMEYIDKLELALGIC